MKKIIIWLARVFKVDITTTITKEVVKEIPVFIPENGIYEGDLIVKGNLFVEGVLKTSGGFTTYCNCLK